MTTNALNLITIPIANIPSDGDSSKRPHQIDYLLQENYPAYLKELAKFYRRSIGDSPAEAERYTFDSLPRGFRLYGRARTNQPNHIDLYCFGHPSGKNWRSTVTFSKHLNHLITNGLAPGCTCEICKQLTQSNTTAAPPPNPTQGPSNQNSSAQAPHSLTGSQASQSLTGSTVSQAQDITNLDPRPRSQRQTRLPVNTNNQGQSSSPLPVMSDKAVIHGRLGDQYVNRRSDEDGAIDLVSYYGWRLKEEGRLNEEIVEDGSIDWLLEHEVANIHDYISTMRLQKMWQPRGGEVVLFIRHMEASQSLRYDETNKIFLIWDHVKRAYIGYPVWEAGLITQQPGEPVAVHDLMNEKGKVNNVVTSGYRVEPVPKVGEVDKPWSKRYTHVPIQHMRPLAYFLKVLHGIKSTNWHPTVRHALTTVASISFINRYYVKSDKHNNAKFTMYNRGMYLGPELIITDDVVRLTPEDEEKPIVTDIMKIKRIKHTVVVGTHDQPEKSVCHIVGKVLTQDPTRAFGMGKASILRDHLPAKCSERYGPWYWAHDPNTDVEIPFTRILSRCYEPEGLLEMFPGASYNAPPPASIYTSFHDEPKDRKPTINADLSYGLESCLKGLEFSREQDDRIKGKLGKEWYWANYRIEQLDINMVRGHDVGAAARYGSDPNTEPRKSKHVLAAFRARRAREKGNKSGVSAGASKTNPVFPSSGLAAAGLNQVDKFQSSGLTAAGLNEGPRYGIKRSRSFEEFNETAVRQRKKLAEEKALAEKKTSAEKKEPFPSKDDVDLLINYFAIPDNVKAGESGRETSGAVPQDEDPEDAFFD